MKEELYGTGHTFLDPADCGSMIAYSIHQTTYEPSELEANVVLSDCNRMINWSFDKNDDSVEKIDNAINILIAFRKDLLKARKLLPKKVESKK